jgi:predicted PurR-regulated permease PerM
MSESYSRSDGGKESDQSSDVKPPSVLSALAVGVIIIAALYFAREIFVPLALAVLLSFALCPLVLTLRRWHFGRVFSVIAVVLLAFTVIFGIGSLIGTQVARLAQNLPQYQSNITDKIESLRGTTAGNGIVGRAAGILKDLGSEMTQAPLATDSQAPNLAPTRNQAQRPVPVEIHQPAPTALDIIPAIIGPLLQPLATTGIVIVFVIFFLMQREDLRDRFIRLAGARDLNRTTVALNDAGRRLSRYLVVQTAINATFGLLIGTGLWLIGVPNAVLWGILAMLLRFVPYIGAVIAALFPATLALAVDPGWSMVLWTGALFLVAEPVTGQVLEPLLYGRSTGLSAVAVVVAAAFWTWLWGPVGLLLSTPLTLCLVVLGRHVARLEFLHIVLGDQPALTLSENFYQRMLANDPDEAAHQAEEFLKENSLAAYFDEIAIGGLALAQLDVNRGAIGHHRRVQIKVAVESVIIDLADHTDQASRDAPKDDSRLLQTPGVSAPFPGEKAVLCIGGRGSLDEAAATMLATLLGREGIAARIVSGEDVSAANMFRFAAADAPVVCISYLEAGGFTNARFLTRRLRRKLPHAKILAGFWTLSSEDVARRDALGQTGADMIVTSLAEAVKQVAVARDALHSAAPQVEDGAHENITLAG